jgi:cardiolipin synthase A/B
MDDNSSLQIKMFSDPLQFYTAMLNDIKGASKSIHLEIFRFRNDPLGIRFRDNLLKKAKEGVKVVLLIDSWGASSSYSFFQDIIKAGGTITFFKKIKLSWDAFTKNHRRDHRKILVIDQEITWMGSANIVAYNFNWRESMFRIKGDIALKFQQVIEENLAIHNKYFYEKAAYTRPVFYNGLEIIREVPSLAYQPLRKKYLELINSAKREILLETPYFLPGSSLRKALVDAARRGVKVIIFIPQKSDVRMLDILTSKYLGALAQESIQVYFYLTQNLHSKIFLVDREQFVVGSANFDYRSFRYQHEICLAGNHKSLIRQMINHFSETKKDTEPFNLNHWMERPIIQRFFEWLLVPLRHLF